MVADNWEKNGTDNVLLESAVLFCSLTSQILYSINYVYITKFHAVSSTATVVNMENSIRADKLIVLAKSPEIGT